MRYTANNQSEFSSKERLYLDDVVSAIKLSSTKYQFYAAQTQNREVRRLCEHIAQHQQEDIQQLQSMFRAKNEQLVLG